MEAGTGGYILRRLRLPVRSIGIGVAGSQGAGAVLVLVGGTSYSAHAGWLRAPRGALLVMGNDVEPVIDSLVHELLPAVTARTACARLCIRVLA
jgi:hypothetical protein